MKFSKAQRMMIGIASGDAFGKDFENIQRQKINLKFPIDHYKGGTGTYTDDTQMSLAVAELMVSDFPFCAETLASNLVYAYRRDKRDGYSSITKGMLEKSWCADDFLHALPDMEKAKRKSDGSAMRAVPIGLFREINEVVGYAMLNSEISHSHPQAVRASVGVALASHFFYYEIDHPKNLIRFVIQNSDGIDKESDSYLESIDDLKKMDYGIILGNYADNGAPYDEAILVLGSVLFLLKHYHHEPPEALRQTTLLGGDVDTTLSIVLGIVMMNHSLDKIPHFLYNDLENGKYGRDYIVKIGDLLGVKYPCIR